MRVRLCMVQFEGTKTNLWMSNIYSPCNTIQSNGSCIRNFSLSHFIWLIFRILGGCMTSCTTGLCHQKKSRRAAELYVTETAVFSSRWRARLECFLEEKVFGKQPGCKLCCSTWGGGGNRLYFQTGRNRNTQTHAGTICSEEDVVGF